MTAAGDALSSVVGSADLTAEFESSTVTGSTGCNSFRGPINVDGTKLQIGPLAATVAACVSPEFGTQERSYLAALQLVTTFNATTDRLELFRPGGLLTVTFKRL